MKRKSIKKNLETCNATFKNGKTSKKSNNKQKYTLCDGVDPKIWGPSLWKTLHIISFNYPIHPTKSNKEIHLKFIKNLRYLLPCKKCRENLCKHFSEDPITMKTMRNRDIFSRYIYNLHEKINGMLGKKSGITYEKAKTMYENVGANDSMQVSGGASSSLSQTDLFKHNYDENNKYKLTQSSLKNLVMDLSNQVNFRKNLE